MSECSGSASTQPRRSTRTRKRTTYCDSEAHEPHSDDGRLKERKPKRRRKTEKQYKPSASVPASEIDQSKPTTRRVRGLLQRLKEFPLDIIYIIFEHLTPQDLLSLARTSKDLRNLLLSRSTISVWKAARSNVEDLPEIPDDMSEPAYAHLCFDAQCHHCDGKQPAVNVFWHNRTRSCRACVDNPSNYYIEPVSSAYQYGERDFVPRSELPRELWAILRSRGDIILGKQRRGYFFVCLANVYQELSDGWKANFNKDDSSWIAARTAEGNVRKKHAKEMANWWQNKSKERSSELAVRRKAREDAILQRLSDIGWAEEIDAQRKRGNLSCLRQFRLGTQAKKLTTKDWDELRPKLEDALQEAKEARLQSELREKWKQRYMTFKSLLQDELDKLPFNTVGPSAFDIADLPQFRDKLFLPIDHELTATDLTDLMAELPEIRSQWVQAREEDLVKLLKDSGAADATPDVLRHAATIFSCSGCPSLSVYPRPLVHKCSRYRSGWSYPKAKEPSFDNFLEATNGRVWKLGTFSYDSSQSTKAKSILLAIGLPVSATVEDVRSSDAWVECIDYAGIRLYPVMRVMYTSSVTVGNQWKPVSPQEAADALRNSRQGTFPQSETSMCSHCDTLLHDSREIIQHMNDEHNVAEYTARDLILHVDSYLTVAQRESVYRGPPPPAPAAEAWVGDTGDSSSSSGANNSATSSVTSQLEDFDS
ncbi:hypothetical protein PQX77_005878 [Marasmius sp. AFHP31]|nr:hypothetical protein PQX77_005878 [Marasmius sp. AFHP31]